MATYAATCFTVRYKRFLGARKQQSDPLCDSNASKCVPEKQPVKELQCPMEGNAVWPSAVWHHTVNARLLMSLENRRPHGWDNTIRVTEASWPSTVTDFLATKTRRPEPQEAFKSPSLNPFALCSNHM